MHTHGDHELTDPRDIATVLEWGPAGHPHATAMATTTHAPARCPDRQLEQLSRIVDKTISMLRAQRKLGAHLEHDDLHNVGMLAGWRAFQTHDPAKGAAFTTYAHTRIHGGLLDYQREQAKENGYSRHRGRIAQFTSLDQPIPDDGGDDLYLLDTISDTKDHANHACDRVTVQRILTAAKHLHPRDQTIVAGYTLDLTQDQIGQALGVTESRVSQVSSRLGHRIQQVQRRPQHGVLLIDRTVHPTETEARHAANEIHPGCIIRSIHKRKVRDGQVIDTNLEIEGTRGRPVWALQLTVNL